MTAASRNRAFVLSLSRLTTGTTGCFQRLRRMTQPTTQALVRRSVIAAALRAEAQNLTPGPKRDWLLTVADLLAATAGSPRYADS